MKNKPLFSFLIGLTFLPPFGLESLSAALDITDFCFLGPALAFVELETIDSVRTGFFGSPNLSVIAANWSSMDIAWLFKLSLPMTVKPSAKCATSLNPAPKGSSLNE